MHQALPAVGSQVRLSLAPMAQHGGPLPGPAKAGQFMAGSDDGAVGDSGT